ncbi:MAG TPA: ATP-binding protein [Pirellulaceae bacterium]|nr:ATP-binding protein [Pirellulaceae bacterium]
MRSSASSIWDADTNSRTTTDEPILYDAKDLCTHAVVVGMTGSGKTGLCLDLLEEAAIDGIPAIAIDPKGDIGNLLLNFPGLSATEFRPWIDEAAARREGLSPDDYAEKIAKRWRDGLAAWDQPADRVTRLRDAADFRIYTPASQAGHPLTVLKSLAAPSPEAAADPDLMRERIASAASGLLALLDVNADPINSREHILLANLLQHAWSQGTGLTLADLFRGIRNPPFERVGILDLESFFPEAERSKLALRLNNLMASPAFAGWMEGEPLDIARLLHTPQGKPRIAVISIAHLSEPERMFFVTLLLNEILSWVRTQPGTSSLRAILYMDEVFGFFPPTANPPSKGPMLSLLKQARAYGLGVVLATQNPVDLDYKGLGNAGTWFLGRLQTERDKARVLEGLEGASIQAGAAFDRSATERTLAALGSRVFLMNNVHDDLPVVFETRWALSYLRGPLTRDDIRRLKVSAANEGTTTTAPAASAPVATPSPAPPVATTLAPTPAATLPTPSPSLTGPSWNALRPAVPGGVSVAAPALTTAAVATSAMAVPSAAPAPANWFVPASIPQQWFEPTRVLRVGERLVYRAGLVAELQLHYAKAGTIDCWRTRRILCPPDQVADGPNWDRSESLDDRELRMFDQPAAGATIDEPPATLIAEKRFASFGKQLKEWAYRSLPLTVLRHAPSKRVSEPGEAEGAFRVRLRDVLDEQRELEIAKLMQSYQGKTAAVNEKIRRANEKLQRETEQYRSKKVESALSIGSSLIGALFGRRLSSATNVSRASTAVKSIGRAANERDDVDRAEESREQLLESYAALETELKERIDALGAKLDPSTIPLEAIEIPPRKSDVVLDRLVLGWIPLALAADGREERLILGFEARRR